MQSKHTGNFNIGHESTWWEGNIAQRFKPHLSHKQFRKLLQTVEMTNLNLLNLLLQIVGYGIHMVNLT